MRVPGRLLIGLILALFSLLSYYGSSSINSGTSEAQRFNLSIEDEVAFGVQAAPQVAEQFGGLSKDRDATALVKKTGDNIVTQSSARKSPYQFAFHLLADPQTVNVFALPGGQIFITEGLFRLLRTPAELAGILGHAVGHVIGRHSAKRVTQQKLTLGLADTAVATDPFQEKTQVAHLVARLVVMRFDRKDELEADSVGARLMAEAGYDPRTLMGLIEVLNRASVSGRRSDFFRSHPNPENRAARFQDELKRTFPTGVPVGLRQ
ncbi:MAG: M48 family metalloprotease [Candidatus Binatia bacterium]